MEKKILDGVLLVILAVGIYFTYIKDDSKEVVHDTNGHGCSKIITKDMVAGKKSIDKNYKINIENQGNAKEGKYKELFNTETVENVYINLEENNWNYLLQNATKKPYVLIDSITIKDKTVKYAGIKTKGNATLHAVWVSNSDRFSFTVNFGKYIKKKNGYKEKQNLYGLSKVTFNNIYNDPSLMKEYLSYKLFDEMGVYTPCYSLVNLYINGDFYGVYMMVESIDDALTERTIGEDNCFLVKPQSPGGNLYYNKKLDKYYNKSTKEFDFNYNNVAKILKDYKGMFENDNKKLKEYTYSINTVFKWIKELNELSESKDCNTSKYKENIESIINVDNLIKYFAVNTYLVNLDSYLSDMMQNYGLCINKEGYMNIYPWDYNNSFGSFGINNAEEMINYDIYNPAIDKKLKNKPLLNIIMQNNDYFNLYKKYLKDCCIIASEGGETSFGKYYNKNYFTKIIDSFNVILSYDYKYDPTAFYSVDEYKKGTKVLKELIPLRSKAVIQQMNGNNKKVKTDLDMSILKVGYKKNKFKGQN